MKFKSTAFRYIYVLLVLLLLIPLSAIANAQETTLITVVPATHTLTIEISGKGSVSVDGTQYSKTTEIQIARFVSPVIEIKAADEYQIDSVLFNNENITRQLSGGKWTMPAMITDATIQVDFEPESGIPATGDTSNICLWLIILLLALIGLIACFWLYRRNKK